MKSPVSTCARCGATFDNEWWLCPSCQGSLEVDEQTACADLGDFSLGEGNTPLLPLGNISEKLGCNLWAKCEFINPTGSFKDRGSRVEIAWAKRLGKSGVVCASTGNMAASLAAYAAKAGLSCKVVVPDVTPAGKLRQAMFCGAKLVRVQGGYDDCVAIAERIASEENYFLCGDYALRRAGQQSIGRELANKGFDTFVVPVGNGTVGVAIAQGLQGASRGAPLPRFVGVQSNVINPIEAAWRSSQPIEAKQNGTTIATAFAVSNPLDGDLTLAWVERTGGRLVTVTDKQIATTRRMLAEQEGLYVENTAAVSLAGFLQGTESNNSRKVVLILTGSGLKEVN